MADVEDADVSTNFNMLQHAWDGKPLQFKSAFDSAMVDKIADAISGKRDDVVASMNGVESDHSEDEPDVEPEEELEIEPEELESDTDEDV